MAKKGPLIGFVGQGFVGGNYADDFEKRGHSVIRYALEPKYVGNKEAIAACDIVFVCVPTPTTPKGFDASIVEAALRLVGDGKIAVVKSTLMPSTTKSLQKKFPKKIILCSPEFLSVATAKEDAAHPFSNIVGMPKKSAAHTAAARRVHAILAKAPFNLTCDSTEAEIIKYAHNANGYFQVMLANILHDLATAEKADWTPVQAAIEADPYISGRYSRPVHKKGRGAGGACFIKDFAALRGLYEKRVAKDKAGAAMLRAIEKKNIELLLSSKKDLEILKGVYGARPDTPLS
jgi:UDPglucose 6-dehydrogenase